MPLEWIERYSSVRSGESPCRGRFRRRPGSTGQSRYTAAVRALLSVPVLVMLLLLAAAHRAAEPVRVSPPVGARERSVPESRRTAPRPELPSQAETRGPLAIRTAPGAAPTALAQPAVGASAPGPARNPAAESPALRTATPLPAIAGVREVPPASRAHAELVASAAGAGPYVESAAPVVRLYLATFGRIPDDEGFEHYVGERDRGTALAAIAEEFAGSREFELRYGALDDAAFVDRLFENVYGESPGAAQRARWLAELRAGATRGDILVALSEGAPFRAATDDDTFVALAYVQATSRLPTAAEHARWVAFLDAGHSRGALVEALIAGRRPGSGR